MGLRDKVKGVALAAERKRRRVELVGPGGVNIQDKRRRAIKTDKGMIRDVQQRMKEYKQGYADKVIDKVKVYKNPGNK